MKKTNQITPLVALIALQDAMEYYGYEASFEDQQAMAWAYYTAAHGQVPTRGVDVMTLCRTPADALMSRPEALIDGYAMMADSDTQASLASAGYYQMAA